MPAIKETVPFSFDENYQYIKNKFAAKGYDTQPGSNAMQIAEAMSYMVSMLNANTAVNVNETLLTLAQKRDMILRDARVLGYEIIHEQSYVYNVDVTITNTNPASRTYVLDTYTNFTSNGNNYVYLGDPITFNLSANPSPLASQIVNIPVKQGTIELAADHPETLNYQISSEADVKMNIPFTHVEEDGIFVFAAYTDITGQVNEAWDRTKKFLISTDEYSDNKFFRLDDIEFGTSAIYFGIGGVKQDIVFPTDISVNLLITKGASGEAGTTFELSDSTIPAGVESSISNIQVSMKGTEEESNTNIKQHAPIYNNAGNRVVNILDYQSFCLREPQVKLAEVWGGLKEYMKIVDPNNPGNITYEQIPGHVWFSFVTSLVQRIFSDSSNPGTQWLLEKEFDTSNWFMNDSGTGNAVQSVFDSLEDVKMPTIQYHHRQPIYLDFIFDIEVAKYINKNRTTDTNEDIFNAINEFFKNEGLEDGYAIEAYNSEYFQSDLFNYILANVYTGTGFNINLKTEIRVIDEQIVFNEPGKTSKVVIHLGAPYETLYDTSDNLRTGVLPLIDTLDFTPGNNIRVDFTEFANITPDIMSAPIYYGHPFQQTAIIGYPVIGNFTIGGIPEIWEEVGEYRVYSKDNGNIEVIMNVNTTPEIGSGLVIGNFIVGGAIINGNPVIGTGTGIPFEAFMKPSGWTQGDPYGAVLDVEYDSPNIRSVRNTIPRLNKVTVKKSE